MGPGNQGKGIAFVLRGLTLANVVGVPVTTWAGQLAGWRITYLVVAGLFVLTLAAITLAVSRQPASAGASVRAELRVFRLSQLWLMTGVAAIGFGGFFAIYTYIAQVVMVEAALPARATPWMLAVFGLGMWSGHGRRLGGRPQPPPDCPARLPRSSWRRWLWSTAPLGRPSSGPSRSGRRTCC